jgi:hypothetical protein
MSTICSRDAVGDSTGLLIGHVRSTETQMPVPGATVAVEWSSILVNEEGIGGRSFRANAVAGEPGGFAVCGLPTEPVLQVRAYHGSDSSGYVEVRVPPQQLRHISFYIGGASTPISSAGGDTVQRGAAQLTGTVVDVGGRPVVGAHALIWDTRITTVTNDRGTFVLQNLPGGTHTLEVRAIGYVPATTTVQLSPARPAAADVTLVKVSEILPTVTVRAELVYSRNLAEFDRRRRAGFGKYVTIADIERRPNAKLSQLLQGQQGIRVTTANGETFVTMERPATQVSAGSAPREACSPSLFVDGVLDIGNDFDVYYADQIVGIEIYREASRPFEFIDARNPCGVVAIWTRPPPAKRAKR